MPFWNIFMSNVCVERKERLVGGEAHQGPAVRGEEAGAGNESHVAALVIDHRQVPGFGLIKFRRRLLQCVGHIKYGRRVFHE